MITMRVRDDRLVNRLPGINVKTTPGTAKAFICKFNKRHENEKLKLKPEMDIPKRDDNLLELFSVHTLDDPILPFHKVEFPVLEIIQCIGLPVNHGLNFKFTENIEFFAGEI